MTIQQTLTGNGMKEIIKSLSYVAVLGVVGLAGYLGVRLIQIPTVVEKPIKSSTLEEKTYVTINGTHFNLDERVGKNLSELERESNELLEKAYEVQKSGVDSKYKEMTEQVVDEAKKAWGLEESVKKTEEPIEKTNYHENIKELNSMYDVIINCGKRKK